MKRATCVRSGVILLLLLFVCGISWAAVGKQPITVNGDTVEFKSDGKEVVAEGHVEIINQDSKMTCDKVRVFIDEKLAIAEGHVKFMKAKGQELQGDMIVYDFSSQTGTIIHPLIRFIPYYGSAQLMEKISDSEFLMNKTELSTCDLPHPHWLMSCKEVKMEPGQTLSAKGIKLSVLDVPLLYVPYYSQQITDKRPRLMITPGYKKNYGMELFGSWRYYLNKNAMGLLHLDWYQKKGLAEGVDLNYNTKIFGMGNAKYYRIDEQDNRRDVPEGERRRNERSKIELRHRWDPSDRDHFVLEYFRQSDPNFRKDYFLREYEKVTNPSSFFLWSHVFPNATLSFLGQPRVNKFDTVLQKIPELKLETVNQKISQSNFYYKSTTVADNLSSATANVGPTVDVSRIDTANQLAYVFRFMSVDFSPFVGHRDTYYSRGVNGNTDLIRTMPFAGLDISTKLFKVYDVKSNLWRLDIDKLRHIITPTVQYRYQPRPSTNRYSLLQLDETDTLDRRNTATLGIENKFQTKRKGVPVDLMRLLVSVDYNFQNNSFDGKGLRNLKYKLEFKPYAWWEFDSDAEFDVRNRFFRTLNADLWATVNPRTSIGFGYRFKKDESSQLTMGFGYQFNPFWKLGVYERFEFKTGNLVEHEYRLERDMHCWTMEFIINQREGHGVTFLLAFKLKAFPDIGIHGEKTFTAPRAP